MQSFNDALALINAAPDTNLTDEIIRKMSEHERRGVILALAKLTHTAYNTTPTTPINQWVTAVREVAENAN